MRPEDDKRGPHKPALLRIAENGGGVVVFDEAACGITSLERSE